MATWNNEWDVSYRRAADINYLKLPDNFDAEPNKEPIALNNGNGEGSKKHGKLIVKAALATLAMTYAYMVSHNADSLTLSRYKDQQLLVDSGNFTPGDGLSVTGPNRWASALLFSKDHPEVKLEIPGCHYQPKFKLENPGTKHESLNTVITHNSENTYIQNGQVLSSEVDKNNISITIPDSQELGSYLRQYVQGKGEIC